MARRKRAAAPARRKPLPGRIDDAILTEQGLKAPDHPTGRILLIACGALAREILQIKSAGGWDHMDLTCLPAILHNHPDRITGAVETAIREHRARYDRLFVAYGDCGTGGRLAAACKRLGVEMLEGPHCYSFYQGNDSFARTDEITAFYLTDFLVRQFDAFIWKPLGLDRHPELRDSYFAHYTRLVYLSQSDDAALLEKAETCARRLKLDFEHRPTGFGDLETAIRGLAHPAPSSCR